MKEVTPAEAVVSKIYVLRKTRVMLDRDLAELYGVETRALVQAVKRHAARFPEDFMFQLTKDEYDGLRSQTVISSSWGGRRYPPYAFTEQGVAMLSSVLNSEQAIQVNVEIIRAFARLRQMLASHRDLRVKVEALEAKYDRQFKVVFDAIKKLIAVPAKEAKKVGF